MLSFTDRMKPGDMNMEEIVAVSGLPGLYRMAANRANGLIIEDLETGKRRFAPARKHNFTPLGSIGVFTDDGESVPLADVFRNMEEQYGDRPAEEVGSSNEDLFEYFADVLPTYDRDRVFPGDIKKIIRWFTFLRSRDLLGGLLDNDSTEEEE